MDNTIPQDRHIINRLGFIESRWTKDAESYLDCRYGSGVLQISEIAAKHHLKRKHIQTIHNIVKMVNFYNRLKQHLVLYANKKIDIVNNVLYNLAYNMLSPLPKIEYNRTIFVEEDIVSYLSSCDTLKFIPLNVYFSKAVIDDCRKKFGRHNVSLLIKCYQRGINHKSLRKKHKQTKF